MSKGLKIAEPPRRRQAPADTTPAAAPVRDGAGEAPAKVPAENATVAKFDHLGEGEKVQFNKRVTRRTADGYEILAIRTRRKVPDLLAEALELLEAKYGRV